MSTEFELWESHAQWWQDEFTDDADPEYRDQILPLCAEHLRGCRRVLDVGAGEGQVSRVARQVGAEVVVALDPVAAQVGEAARRGGGVLAVRGAAAVLPFVDHSFDAVVGCLVFEHVDDLDGSFAEIARVLAPGGRFLLLLNHPLIQTPGSGWIDDQVLQEQYWRIGMYLPEAETVEEVWKGVHIRFLHRPLSRYVNLLAGLDLHITSMVEPAPPASFLELCAEYALAGDIPRLMLLRTEKRS